MDRDLGAHVTGRVIGAAIDVHRELGPGLLESAYEECLARELDRREISYARQVLLPLFYRGCETDCRYKIDLVVQDRVVVEVKSVEQIAPVHGAQVLTYLRLSGYPIGLLINFNNVLLKNGVRRFALSR